MASNPFNPGGFAKKDNLESQKSKTAPSAPYGTTGNSSRDLVRKMFWELFTQLGEEEDDNLADL